MATGPLIPMKANPIGKYVIPKDGEDKLIPVEKSEPIYNSGKPNINDTGVIYDIPPA